MQSIRGIKRFYKKEGEKIMMDKRKAAEIILQAIAEHAPVQINWNHEDLWINAILRGLTEVEKAETPGAATPEESR